MRPAWAFVALAAAFALAEARGDSDLVRSARGGLVTKTAHYQFEVYFYRTGLRIFPERAVRTPLAVSLLVGRATFYHPNSPKLWFSRPLTTNPSASSLDLAIGLGDVPAVGVMVTIAVEGLPETSEPTTTFAVPLEFVIAPASSGSIGSTPPARSWSELAPLFPDVEGLGYPGLGDSFPTRHGSTSHFMIAPRISLRGYGRVTSSPSPGGPLPFVSGHAIFFMPSAGRDVPLARPWLRPTD